MAAIYDVARAAGVSITTVSQVANNTRTVSEETKNRVLQAIEEPNYDCVVNDRRPVTGAWEGARDIELFVEIIRHARAAAPSVSRG